MEIRRNEIAATCEINVGPALLPDTVVVGVSPIEAPPPTYHRLAIGDDGALVDGAANRAVSVARRAAYGVQSRTVRMTSAATARERERAVRRGSVGARCKTTAPSSTERRTVRSRSRDAPHTECNREP